MKISFNPRACARGDSAVRKQHCLGSSPHVRGTSQNRSDSFTYLRFIPACAGNITQEILATLYCSVHPRMCGEHMCPALSSREINGSSPHVRGTSAYSPRDYQPTRFIPACAGNIVATNSHMARLTVHPRMCGEHPTMQICTLDISGSSPHVRGTYICNAHANRSTRFIPACAGNILYILDCHIPFTVHPRMCGEHFIASSLTFSNSGSSPHVRGT